ncbi:UbiA family prenyltransferase [Streptomyces pathocidini]|uniref:UbiA family prenyltransferase n=1 Tax=Streptomyces pathocidini TaxID=1650571 RepID=UPI0033D4CB78
MMPEEPSRSVAATATATATAPGPVLGLLAACHPLPSAAVTVLVTVLAASAGRSGVGCALVACAVLAGQLSVGWCNDAIDAHRDVAAGRSGKPVVAGAVTAGGVRAAALCALVLCVPLSLASGMAAGVVHLAGVAAAWAYNLGLKSTAWSWFPYAIGFGGLPAFVTLGLPGRPWPPWWVVAAAALLGVGAHLANVLPDIDDDLRHGVRGWPQRLGATRARLLLPVPLLAATGLLILPNGPVAGGGTGEWRAGWAAGLSGGWAAGWLGGRLGGWLVPGAVFAAVVAVSCGAAAVGRSRPRVPFLVAIGVAALDVALLLARTGS